jgi:hypothetical protein
MPILRPVAITVDDLRRVFLPPATDVVPAPAAIVLTDPDACSNAAKVMTDVCANEESRFNNLNGRAVAVLSALALVTTLLGIFSTSFLDSKLTRHQHTVALWGTDIAVLLLMVSAGLAVFGVLQPGRRYVFGNNELTNGTADLRPVELDKLIYREFGGIYANLASRSLRKAWFLERSYYAFFAALLVGAASMLIILSI